MTENELMNIINEIKPVDEEIMKQAEKRQDSLAKPTGSLGRLEDMSIQLAGITGKIQNNIDK